MTALWESSTRSLFVKTVWKDGHRHVLLQEKPDTSDRKSSRETSKPRTKSSRSSVSDSPPAPYLRVPSVKLRLKKFKSLRIDSVKNNKGRKSSKKKKFKAPLENQQKVEEICIEPEEFRLKSQFNESKYRRMTKSYTFDVEDASRNSILAGNYPIGTKLLQADDDFTSLSDRVLMWLDLATQNGSCSDSIANFKRVSFGKPRIVTASVISGAKTFFEKSTMPFRNQYRFAYDEEDSFTSDFDEDCYSSDDSILKCKSINFDKGKARSDEVSDGSEEDVEKFEAARENKKHPCCVNDKRQLHIFMPNLPQTLLEVDEISIVSKCSSIVQLDET